MARKLKKSKKKFKEVPVSKLRWTCGTDVFKFKSTKNLKVCNTIIGQDKAVKALRMGLDIEGVGYNVFVTGAVGTGRTTSVKCLLEEVGKKEGIPDDKCYVNNFANPDMPRLMTLPAGKGKLFKKDMDELVKDLVKSIPLIFESESYQNQRNKLVDKYREIEKKLVSGFEKKVKKQGFILVQVQVGPFSKPEIAPLVDGKPASIEQLQKLVGKGEFSEEKLEKLTKKRSQLNEELGNIFRETRSIEKKARKELLALDTTAVLPFIKQNMDEIKEAASIGILDGVTTNPTLLAKEKGKGDFRTIIKKICEMVDGPVSAEVVALDADGMVKEAEDLSQLHKNVVVKIPMCKEGLKAIKTLDSKGIPTNCTLIFSPIQALLAAKAGASFVSPFVGRLDDASHVGMDLVEDIVTIFENYEITTEVIVASIRNPLHVVEAATMGADIATIPFKVIGQLIKHPLTDIGINKFLEDWKKVDK